MYGFAAVSPSIAGYVSSVIVIGSAIVWLRRAALPGLLAAGLAIAVIATLAGGLINAGQNVLYNASIGPYSKTLGTHFLQYDHLAHAYVSFVTAFTWWIMLAVPHAGANHRRELVILAVGAALGLGALNEMVEFLATLGTSRSTCRRVLEHRLGSRVQLHRGRFRRAGHRQIPGRCGLIGGNTGMTSGGGWSRVRLGCAATSAAVFASAVILIGSLTPGYDQWSDPVSRLASPGEPWALAARAAFAAYCEAKSVPAMPSTPPRPVSNNDQPIRKHMPRP